MNTRDIQTALLAKGFDPDPIDGIAGRRTFTAVKAFQAANNLVVDGIVGPKTTAKLFGEAVPASPRFSMPVTMPWLQAAYSLIGTRERPGRGSNEAIIGWADELGIEAYNDDDIPWCGLFVAHCIGSQLPDEHLPNNPLGARQWERFGKGTVPQLGAVMVFWRESRASGKGHVGFYWAEDEQAYHILGGNQSNTVSVTRIARDRLLQARWPSSVPGPTGIVRHADAHGKILSENEA